MFFGLKGMIFEFQFHKGAIRTIEAHFGVRPNSQFQFHKGAIRTLPNFSSGAIYKISIP